MTSAHVILARGAPERLALQYLAARKIDIRSMMITMMLQESQRATNNS